MSPHPPLPVAPGARLGPLLSSPVLSSPPLQTGLANSTSHRGRHTNQLILLTLMNVGGVCFALHAAIKSTSVVFCFSFHLLFYCCSFMIYRAASHDDLVSCLLRPPSLLNTLIPLCLSYRKKRTRERKRGRQRERERPTPCVAGRDRKAAS